MKKTEPRRQTNENSTTDGTDPRSTRRSALKMAGAAGGLLLGGTGLSAIGVDTADAVQIVVDDFEHREKSFYDFNRKPSAASFTPTSQGATVLQITGAYCSAIRTDSLNVTPVAGDSISYWMYATSDSGTANRGYINYGVQDHGNYYFAFLDFDDDRLNLSRWKQSSQHILADTTVGYKHNRSGGHDPADTDVGFTFSEDQWYEVVVDWGRDGTHTVTVFDEVEEEVASVTAADSTWTSGGIGFDTYLSGSETVYYDSVTIN